jgi:hypothetical protein
VRLVSANPPTRAVDQLIDLPGERINQRPPPRTLRQPAALHLARGDQPGDRLVITPSQRRRPPQRSGQVIRLKDLHRFLRFLHLSPGLQVAH